MRPFDDVRVVRLQRVWGGGQAEPPVAVRVFPRRTRDGAVDRDVPAVWRRRNAGGAPVR
jgi:hypothetical protein